MFEFRIKVGAQGSEFRIKGRLGFRRQSSGLKGFLGLKGFRVIRVLS